MFLPVDADDDIGMFNGLKSDVQKLQERFASMEQPAPIPMLPELVDERIFSPLQAGTQAFICTDRAS